MNITININWRINGVKKLTVEEIVSRLRPIDDIFFHKLAEIEGFCEELLQVILKNNIELIEVTPQKSLRNIKAKSVTIDVYCVDTDNKYYVTVQSQADFRK